VPYRFYDIGRFPLRLWCVSFAPSLMRRRASPRFRQPQTKGTLNRARRHDGIHRPGVSTSDSIDVIHPSASSTCAPQMPDSALRHYRNGDRFHYRFNHRGVGHPCHAAGFSDSEGTLSSAITEHAPASPRFSRVPRVTNPISRRPLTSGPGRL